MTVRAAVTSEPGSATARRSRSVAAVGIAAFLLAGCQDGFAALPGSAPATKPAASTAVRAQQALRQLERLPVRPHVSLAGYSRLSFGPAWPTINGCNARERALARDMTHVVLRKGGCVVETGTLLSPYNGQVIHFRRGPATSDQVEVDHVVALADAAMTGADKWSPARREAFANDPLELLAVDRASNQAKGDRNAAGYLPPRRQEDCPYVEKQIAVKIKYHLWLTAAEHKAIASTLRTCL